MFLIKVFPQEKELNISGFVGGDALADIVKSKIYKTSEISLLLDIGTNTEIVLGNSDRLLCTSAAAGPALEGARISMGMRAEPGAIASGIGILIKEYGIQKEDITTIFLAGAFGNYLSAESALRIGMFPEISSAKIESIKDAVLEGAKEVLFSRKAETLVTELSDEVRHIDEKIFNYNGFDHHPCWNCFCFWCSSDLTRAS